MKRLFFLFLICLLFLPAISLGEEGTSIYHLTDENGNHLCYICADVDTGDEYISKDNISYLVIRVDKTGYEAICKNNGVIALPDVSYLDDNQAVPVASMNKRIGMYCTHSDESYKKGDGKSSDEKFGGIYDIAGELKNQLTGMGIQVEFDQSTHLPHDAGAYRRSRATAARLLEKGLDALFDIHRDGIPDPDEYTYTYKEKAAVMVRLLVGRSNQNASANKSFAVSLKTVADKLYPGLIKDIFIGKGTYNQDLAPRALLLEFGTHTSDKEAVLRSTVPMGDVIYKTIYGAVTGSAGFSDVSGSSKSNAPGDNSKGAGTGIIWVVVILVAGLIVFAFLSGGKNGFQKLGRSVREMTGGLFGKKPDK